MKRLKTWSSITLALTLTIGAASTVFAGEGDNVQNADDDGRKLGSKTTDKDGKQWYLARARTGWGEQNMYFSPDGSGNGGEYKTQLECPCENDPEL